MAYFGQDDRWAFNFLSYEAARKDSGAGFTENIINLFLHVAEIGDQTQGQAANDQYWQRAMKQLLRNAIEVLMLARGGISLADIYELINSAPQNREEAQAGDWQKTSFCYACLRDAEQKAAGDPRRVRDFELSAKYWLMEFPGLAEKTRSVIVSTFTSLADCFLRGRMRELFCEETTIVPELILKGAVVVVALPQAQYGEVGQFAGCLWKYMFQKTVERRADLGQDSARPCFLWVDECQKFTNSYDQMFQTTARSSRACTVYLTQNIPNLYGAFGGERGKAQVDSLLGNLGTRIFHQNSDKTTNEWAADTIARVLQYRAGANTGTSAAVGNLPTHSAGSNVNAVVDYDLQPRVFTELRRGGPANKNQVDGIVYQNGRQWSTDKRWLLTAFDQNQ
jgi:hypothetical protein